MPKGRTVQRLGEFESTTETANRYDLPASSFEGFHVKSPEVESRLAPLTGLERKNLTALLEEPIRMWTSAPGIALTSGIGGTAGGWAVCNTSTRNEMAVENWPAPVSVALTTKGNRLPVSPVDALQTICPERESIAAPGGA